MRLYDVRDMASLSPKNDGKQFWNSTYDARAMVGALDFTKKVMNYCEAGSSILDVGCGDGRDSLYFAQNGLKVTAIDFSEKAIERVHALGAPIDARAMDTTRMDFPDASFDVVYAHLSLHYFDDTMTTEVFANIHRMLKPRGHFFVRCKSTEDPYYGQGERVGEHMFLHPYLRRFFTEEYMRGKLALFDVLELGKSSSNYDGKESCFIDAIAQKESIRPLIRP